MKKVAVEFTHHELNVLNEILEDSFNTYQEASERPGAHLRNGELVEEIRKLGATIDAAKRARD